MSPAWLGIIIPVAVALGTALGQFLLNFRVSRGVIRTSEADVLWQQSQKFAEMLQRRLERAEDQRDKLLDLQEHQLMPILEAITQSQKHQLGMLTEMVGRQEKQASIGE